MAFSAESSDHDTDTEEDEKETSRFVVGADQLRDGEFETLDELREVIATDEENG